mmetsp:Transcript_4984/g.12892  ORF Transcript_4984/g.12892 Transcript_4984/m.12892 type:complete len:273 (-) Transcript_4984:589-1407(-)
MCWWTNSSTTHHRRESEVEPKRTTMDWQLAMVTGRFARPTPRREWSRQQRSSQTTGCRPFASTKRARHDCSAVHFNAGGSRDEWQMKASMPHTCAGCERRKAAPWLICPDRAASVTRSARTPRSEATAEAMAVSTRLKRESKSIEMPAAAETASPRTISQRRAEARSGGCRQTVASPSASNMYATKQRMSSEWRRREVGATAYVAMRLAARTSRRAPLSSHSQCRSSAGDTRARTQLCGSHGPLSSARTASAVTAHSATDMIVEQPNSAATT